MSIIMTLGVCRTALALEMTSTHEDMKRVRGSTAISFVHHPSLFSQTIQALNPEVSTCLHGLDPPHNISPLVEPPRIADVRISQGIQIAQCR